MHRVGWDCSRLAVGPILTTTIGEIKVGASIHIHSSSSHVMSPRSFNRCIVWDQRSKAETWKRPFFLILLQCNYKCECTTVTLLLLPPRLGGSILQTINGVRLAKPVPSQHHDNDLSLTPYAFTETEWPSLMSFGEEVGDRETYSVNIPVAIV